MNDDRRQADFGPEAIRCLDTRFEICQNVDLVLEIGREYQNKDGFRGAHFDTVKLLCDTIEYLSEQRATRAGDCAKLREAMVEILEYIESFHKYITPDKTKGLITLFAVADTIRNKARAALAAPATTEKSSAVGDAAKLREALEHIVNERGILDFCHNNLGSKTREDWDKVYMTLRKWIDEAMAALAATKKEGGAK